MGRGIDSHTGALHANQHTFVRRLVGDSLPELADVRTALEAAGLTVHMALDHKVSQRLYITDPDGNLIELYVDATEQIWRDDPSVVAKLRSLALDLH